MSAILIKNIGTLVTGKLESPLRQADSIFVRDGIIQAIGNGLSHKADQTIDANGITAIPGLIDSHSHPSIGEYTPAQNSLGWITNYMHGGVTALISAGELHLPGLPLPPDARTALSVASDGTMVSTIVEQFGLVTICPFQPRNVCWLGISLR